MGWGPAASDYAGLGPAPATTNTTSISRDEASANTADNAADFAVGAPTPQNSTGDDEEEPEPEPEPEPDPETRTIAEIQGTGETSPLVGQTVTTRGVVTASYPPAGTTASSSRRPAPAERSTSPAMTPPTPSSSSGPRRSSRSAPTSRSPASSASSTVSPRSPLVRRRT
ncbi:hypothetical protein [Microbacterium sp. NIBRBAC000506063]|uniref:hypothetical protein n=1 Tax=Microbacterium sp. NIBRBAC000506063 TaxID=2734618 RepID=UPI001CB7221B|nr:hypothetical protein [Microbacterium sp. NIBRBAC000506063]